MARRFAHIAAATALLCTLPLAAPASACSVVPEYRVPTNLQLAMDAELILLGRVVGEVTNDEDVFDRSITVQPLEAIKGTMPDAPLSLEGMALTEGELERYTAYSNPYQLEAAHPTSYIGGCIRYLFPRGTTALFFLKRQDGNWVAAGGPFSRWAEDVLAEDAPWLALTRLYTRAAPAPEGERTALLEAERTRRAAMDDTISQLMAQDIARQLAGPNDRWNDIMDRAIAGEEDIDPTIEPELAADALAELIVEDGEDPDGMADAMEVVDEEDGSSLSATIDLDAIEEEEAEPVPDR